MVAVRFDDNVQVYDIDVENGTLLSRLRTKVTGIINTVMLISLRLTTHDRAYYFRDASKRPRCCRLFRHLHLNGLRMIGRRHAREVDAGLHKTAVLIRAVPFVQVSTGGMHTVGERADVTSEHVVDLHA